MTKEYTSRAEKKQSEQQNKKKSPRRKWWKRIIFILLASFLLVSIVIGAVIVNMILNTPKLEASDLETPLSTQIYNEDEELIGTVFDEENRVQIDIEDVPDEMKDAIVSIEDKRFYKHNGVDFRRILKAVLANIKHGWGSEGGSTISQQVIKRSVLSSEKTLERKVQEAWLAIELEREYSKDEILELYLNNVYLGNGSYGIKTASKSYFSKDIKDLNLSQMAMLAGLPNAPSLDDPIKDPERAKQRRNKVIQSMANNKITSEEEAEEAKAVSIEDMLDVNDEEKSTRASYNAFIDTVYNQLIKQGEVISEDEFYQGGLKIYTTVEPELQQAVYDVLHSDDIPYPDDDFETGIALIDTKTGDIRAIGGGRNFKSIRDTNYGAAVKQQPGSTIKPVLDYAPAIEHLEWSTAHMLSDEEYQYSDGTPIKEWDNEYWGSITMRRALEWSRNIPALKAFQEVGEEKAQEFAKGLGIEIDPIYESSSLGGFDGASPLQMAGAYAAFGNGGEYNQPLSVKKIVYPDGKEWEPEENKPTEAMQDYTAYMTTDMLKTVITSGTGSQANVPELPIAGKTGSTNIPEDIRNEYGIYSGLLDSWFVGYTPQYALAVWTGYPSFKNKDGEPQYIIEDGTQHIAKQIFRKLMSEISDPLMDDFEKPDSVISIGSELYIEGTQPVQEPQEQYEEPEPEPEPEEEPEEDEENEEEENEENEEENNDENQEENEENTENDQQENDGQENENEEENNDEYQENGEDEYQEENGNSNEGNNGNANNSEG